MKKAAVFAVVIVALLASVTTADAHRLDEYLQATTISVTSRRLHMEMRLAPGVAIASTVLDSIDIDRDGSISQEEQRRYSQRVIDDLFVTLDKAHITINLASWRFASVDELKHGVGEIQLMFDASVPERNSQRILVFDNRHRNAISVYLVNSLVPEEPGIHITSQNRNYVQSRYEMSFEQASIGGTTMSFGSLGKWMLWIGGGLLVVIDRAAAFRRRRVAIQRSR